WTTVSIADSLTNAVVWGRAKVDPDPDGAIRRMDMGSDLEPSVGWVVARVLGGSITQQENNRLRDRWLNYYGPPGNFVGVDFDRALATNGLGNGFFRDKIVVICAGSGAGLAGTGGEDEFGNPHSRFGARKSYGGEVHAQTILNLLNGDW